MVNEDDIRKIAKLAHLHISDSETTAYAKEVNSILEYVDQLKKVDVSKIEPLSHIHGAINRFREDEVTQSLSNEEALKNAPDRSGRFFRVPIIIEQSGEH